MKFEVRNVREWVKVTAWTRESGVKSAVDTNSYPMPVEVTKGKDANVFEYTPSGKDKRTLTSVVFPLVEGKEREFSFAYTGNGAGTAILSATWPKGAPEAKLVFRQK